MTITWIIMDNTPRPAPLIRLLINLIPPFSQNYYWHMAKLGEIYIIFSIVVVFNFMLEHFELVKCPLCSSFCCVLLIFLYGIKGCFLSKIYSLNILLNQHPTQHREQNWTVYRYFFKLSLIECSRWRCEIMLKQNNRDLFACAATEYIHL